MKTTLITIAFAAASLPMFAAQAPANPPASGAAAQTKPAKTKKVHHKKVKKASKSTAPASK